jgi:hypothetical protein
MDRQSLAHLQALNTAVANVADLVQALGEAFAYTVQERSS